ncbi:hypothetical protein LCGC14_0531260 [marine sediment metagenome]|uniref:Uncharacterized protein n=1 Tax=marine sediment metagenome TaxID=412755 RepID=A0A0F9RVK3_9ZZZZ
MAFVREDISFFMIKEHPTEDLVMFQMGNHAIQLDAKYQKRIYGYLKERLLKKTKLIMVYYCIDCENKIIRPIKPKERMLMGVLRCDKCNSQIITEWVEVEGI